MEIRREKMVALHLGKKVVRVLVPAPAVEANTEVEADLEQLPWLH